MKRSQVFVLSGALILTTAMLSPDDGGTTDTPSPVDEVDRVRVHLDRAVRFLDKHEPAVLTATAGARRQKLAQMVGEYRDRGIFPHGHQESGLALFFVDEHGTPCALATLIQRTGRSDIVDAVRSRMNEAWVYEIVQDPELGPILVAWLEENGLTVADAATIQVPGYIGRNASPTNVAVTPMYGVASAASLGTSAVSTTFNVLSLGSRGSTAAWLGLFSGAASVALGVAELDAGGERRTLATVNAVSGLATFAFSAVRLLTAPDQAAVVLPGTRFKPEIQMGESGRPMVGLRFAF